VNEQDFLDYFRDSFLWQHVTQPTRFHGDQTANILELIMTNEERMIDDLNYVDPTGKKWPLNHGVVVQLLCTNRSYSGGKIPVQQGWLWEHSYFLSSLDCQESAWMTSGWSSMTSLIIKVWDIQLISYQTAMLTDRQTQLQYPTCRATPTRNLS